MWYKSPRRCLVIPKILNDFLMWHSSNKSQSVSQSVRNTRVLLARKNLKEKHRPWEKMQRIRDQEMMWRAEKNNRSLDMDIQKRNGRDILSALGLSWNLYLQPGFTIHICRLWSSALKSSLNLSTIYIRLITKMEFGPDCCVINLIHSNKHKHEHLKDLKCWVNISKDFEIAGKGWCFIFGPPLI